GDVPGALAIEEDGAVVVERIEVFRAGHRPARCFRRLGDADGGAALLPTLGAARLAARRACPGPRPGTAALAQISPRFARFRISAPAPNVHGSASDVWMTVFDSRPSRGEATVTTSPTLWVKPWPLTSRSSTGANIVPR